MVDGKELTYCLGIRICQEKSRTIMMQDAYLERVLERFNMQDMKAIGTPLNMDDIFDVGEPYQIFTRG